jgi:DNA repair exonuclease SbcCD ATPase subunit
MPDVLEEYNKLKTERELLEKQLRKKRRRILRLNRDIKAHDEAQLFLSEVSKLIHKETVEKIENLVTLCLRAVYERPFKFRLDFKEKRKSIEAEPIVQEGKHEFNPKEDKGGGMIDLISFAFRIILWNIQEPKTRRLFVLDEPFKRAGAYVSKIGPMLRYLSEQLKLQMIILTHEDKLRDICDRVYMVTHDGRRSIVKLIKGLQRR